MSWAFDHAALGMALSDMDGHYLDVNRQFSEMLGFSREELLQMNFLDITASSHSSSEENLQRLRRGEADKLVVEKRYRRKNGSEVDVQVTVEMVPNEGRSFLFTQVQDVTDRKRAEKKLRKKRTELSTLIGNLQGMVYRCLLDHEWTMMFLSDPCESITGYKPEELVDNKVISYASIIHPDDRQRVHDSIMQAMEAGQGFTTRYRIIRADGSERWVMEQGSATRYEDEDTMHLQGYISDITEHVELEQRYQRLFDNLPYGVADITTDMELLAMNQAFISMMGVEQSEDGVRSFFSVDNETEGLISRSLRIGSTLNSEVHRDGRTYYITVIPQSDRRTRSVQVVLQDVTELRKAGEALAREESRLRLFLNSLDLFAYVKDSDLRYTMVNSAYARFLGLSEAEIIGHQHQELDTKMSMDGNLETDLKVMEGGISQMYEVIMHGRVLKVRKFPLDLREGQNGVGALISDISVRKRMEDADAFLHYLLSHDLKNKLTVILGYQDLLHQACEPEQVNRFLDAIEKASQDGVELIDKVELMKRLSSASETSPVNLRVAIKRVEAQFHQRLEDAEMTMQADYDSLDISVQGGPLIHELFSNLVENCINHSRGSRIQISARDQGEHILCLVEDDGRGLDDTDKPLLFDRGFRKGRRAGSGLGSYLAHRITEFYKAEIFACDSDIGGLCIGIRFRKV